MVNPYMLMWRFCKLKGVKQPYNHHQFQEMVGYALIDPDSEWPTRKRYSKSSKSSTPSPPEQSDRKSRMSAKSLHPTNGSLKKRLDTTLNAQPHPGTLSTES